jgi:hypothetical protein
MKNEKLNKDFAYPAIFDLRHEETFATHRGLTKLELISAMCLQGLLGCQDGFYKDHIRASICKFIVSCQRTFKTAGRNPGGHKQMNTLLTDGVFIPLAIATAVFCFLCFFWVKKDEAEND